MNFSCSVCYIDFKEDNNIVCTGCGHVFHKKCLDKWTKRSETCPQCRKDTIPSQIRPIYLNSDQHDIINNESCSSWRSTLETISNGNSKQMFFLMNKTILLYNTEISKLVKAQKDLLLSLETAQKHLERETAKFISELTKLKKYISRLELSLKVN